MNFFRGGGTKEKFQLFKLDRPVKSMKTIYIDYIDNFFSASFAIKK